MIATHIDKGHIHVALRKESVDRNLPMCIIKRMPLTVALRKESVDRNPGMNIILFTIVVALRKESVDRNAYGVMPVSLQVSRSPQGERG